MQSSEGKEVRQSQARDIHKKKYSDSYGVTTDESTSMARDPTLNLWENVANWNFSHSSSDVGEKEPKGSVAVKSTKKSASDLVLETYARSLSGRRLSIGSVESFLFPSIEMALDSNLLSSSANNLDKENDGVSESLSSINPVLDKPKDECGVGESLSIVSTVLDDPINEYPTIKKETIRTYYVSKKNTGLSKIPLPGSAASFYSGTSTQMEVIEVCESNNRLTGYLNARRTDVNAGIPGRFLHAVMGQDASDVGSFASTILYAFYLDEMLNDSRLCTIPIINMKRADLNMHAELKWLLDSCQIDQSSLVFIDEIDLSYYDQFGSLKLVLLNGHKLPTKLEALQEALVEIFNCKQANSLYPWVDKVTMEQGSSCCTIIAEKFALTSPEILGGQYFSRLLLAGILFDTGNLKNAQCTTKDKYMSTLLIKGAGRFGCNGLYQICMLFELMSVNVHIHDCCHFSYLSKRECFTFR
ncbi:exopolyphosphatase PRUNE1-like protein isoform X1 [Cinnamomum micranthum f. kanehirae]|uniref:Exopolyphosphatase PRUNE1-like protein isoform X1 n=1 Tax=Cinnamomum micranthum f. kanehirae TaxID=337451 RepID=A0A443PD62_9MAGN|nr:exopolyphosphatase PRUNE1-like protein isoform X1 [Cinnamomum micranthum f. kanehirae]